MTGRKMRSFPGIQAADVPKASELVTPVILTYNEEANIGRTLRALTWAKRVVILDSGSSDSTEVIARRFHNVTWQVHAFESHQKQWTHAVHAMGIETDFVLALDADHEVSQEFVHELESAFLPGAYTGGIAPFEYRLMGRSLLGSVYPPRIVIFKRSVVSITQPGHTQELAVEGSTYRFHSRLIHDDRKTLARFVASQLGYAELEAARLAGSSLRWQDRLRRAGVMPPIMMAASFFLAGGPLRGRAAFRYCLERTVFECLLALRLFEKASSGGQAFDETDSA